jgi:SAM-dependent methyltransferase
VTDAVAAGYEAVYAAWRSSPTFHEIWARHAVDGSVAAGFEHLNLAGLDEMARVRDELDLHAGDRLLDVACGAGAPGAWVARETRTHLVGIDLARNGATLAAERARTVGLATAGFVAGSVDRMPFGSSTFDGAMSLDSLQYVPDKRGAFGEVARVLRSGGRFVFAAFEVDPDRVKDVPVLGVDPIADYSVVLGEVGFLVEQYEETPGWRDRLVAAYSAILDADSTLRPEMGTAAMDALALEMSLTLQLEPYARRVLAVARSR